MSLNLVLFEFHLSLFIPIFLRVRAVSVSFEHFRPAVHCMALASFTSWSSYFRVFSCTSLANFSCLSLAIIL
jgi:hypothetical protein